MKRMNKKLIGVVPDIHIPKHDPEALNWCFRRLTEERPGHIVFLGDMFDFESISVFLKKPSFDNMFSSEIKEGCKFVERVKRLQKKIGCKITMLGGNHETRLSKYLWKNAPELADIPGLTIPALMNMPEDWKYISYNSEGIMIDGVTFFHGRKYSNNVCASNIKKFYSSVVQGHGHRSTSHYVRRPDGKLLGAVEAGCLCELNPNYASHVDWSHAMAFVKNGVPYLELKGEK
ncbi:MAG: hypothetical protein DRJ03_04685 [Chloroflexi bacterium]|nr:MAG: hypothetical protein DRJ03_04685 [Chloroflexota bacterium]